MPTISSIYLVISLVLAVVIGPQTRVWSWGPALLSLGVSVLAALPVVWRKGRSQGDFGIIAFATLTAAWFAWRAWNSPVAEYGQADLVLLVSAVCAFISMRGIMGDRRAEGVLAWGVALLLLANLVVVGMQIMDPTYSPVFRTRAVSTMVSGFLAHYNEAANFLIAASMLVGASALVGRHAMLTRVFFGLLALGGLAGIWFTTSRGGILGASAACLVGGVVWLVIIGRRKSKWFAPAVIILPILLAAAVTTFLFKGWESAQETRKVADTSVESLLDNDKRLFFLGTALSCAGTHWMAGGGSRSFSWECNRFADSKAQGDMSHKPEFVHNELVQSATDYGLIGAGLLVGLLGALVIACLLRVMFDKPPESPDSSDALRLGALAALAGMMVQSSFSFVFHLLPGILLLGICLGQISRSRVPGTGARVPAIRTFLSLSALAGAALLFATGWRGTRVTHILWTTYFSKAGTPSEESGIDALTEAVAVWPQSEFHQRRAEILQREATATTGPDAESLAERALADYRKTAELQPFDPVPVINLATLLSRQGHDRDAEDAFAKAITLQGGMEQAYRSRFLLACHYHAKGMRVFTAGDPNAALDLLHKSAEEIEAAVLSMHWLTKDILEPRVAIHESLGVAREAAGDPEGALESYNFAATLRNGTRAHYRAGVLLGNLAVARWGKRQAAEAMYGFIEAKKRVTQAGNQLPQGVTPSDRVEYIDYLDRSINFLKGAKIEPREW